MNKINVIIIISFFSCKNAENGNVNILIDTLLKGSIEIRMNKTVYDSIVSYRDRYLFGEEGLQDMHIYFSRHDSIDYFTIMTDIQFSPQRKIYSSIAKRKFEFLQIPVKDVNAYLIFDREHVENLPFSFSPIQLDNLRFKYIKKKWPENMAGGLKHNLMRTYEYSCKGKQCQVTALRDTIHMDLFQHADREYRTEDTTTVFIKSRIRKVNYEIKYLKQENEVIRKRTMKSN